MMAGFYTTLMKYLLGYERNNNIQILILSYYRKAKNPVL